MKLLLDENLSRRLVPFLQHDYPGSNQVVLMGMESASDKEIWQRAKEDGYVIVTGVVQKRLFSGNTGVPIPPSKVRDFGAS
jgi:hypothetical protein